MPLQRFEAATLEEALEQARREAGPEATAVEANRVRRGGVGGFFAKQYVEVVVEVAEATAPTIAPAPGLAGMLEAADAEEAVTFTAPAPVATPTLSTEQAGFQDLVLRLAKEQAPSIPSTTATTVLGAEARATARVPAPGSAVRAPVPVSASPVPALSDFGRLGLPAAFTVDLATESPDQAVLRALQALPRATPLPTAPGSVVAVVGERDGALALARSLADELGLDPDDVALAAEDDHGDDLALGRLLPSVHAVSEARWHARYHSRPSVVAVAVPVGRTTSSWARRALEALDPTVTWAHTAAIRKAEDVLEWSERLGGVDAVAVDGIDETASPAAILGTGIPVARIDGRRATPALWAAILTERLAA